MLKFLPTILILSWANFSSAGENVHVYVHNEPSYSGVRFYEMPEAEQKVDPCFPYGCNGGITGPFPNPDPNARKPENLTACIYGADNTLVYEREDKHCPYKFEDPNVARVEKRRQEWLNKNKGNLGR